MSNPGRRTEFVMIPELKPRDYGGRRPQFKILAVTGKPGETYMTIAKEALVCSFSRPRIHFHRGDQTTKSDLRLVKSRCTNICGPKWYSEDLELGTLSNNDGDRLGHFRYASRLACSFLGCCGDAQKANIEYRRLTDRPDDRKFLKLHGRTVLEGASHINFEADGSEAVKITREWSNNMKQNVKGIVNELLTDRGYYHLKIAPGMDEMAAFASVYCWDEQKQEAKQADNGSNTGL